MSVTPQQLDDELRTIVRGRVSTDAITRGLFATDASPFFLLPTAVVVPADTEDLIAVVRYAHEHGVPIVPRGAGTGLAGESLGSGIVLDLSVNFRSIGEITADTVTAQVGVTLAELNAELAKHGRRFAPDPASGASCTLGGMIATNASGGSVFRHGYTRDHVLGLKFLTDDGREHSIPESPFPEDRVEQLRTLLRENREAIHTAQARTPFNRCGYLLHDVLTLDGLDLVKLLVGSEGTLGIFTEATLRTIPLAGGVCQFLVGFPTLEAALRTGADLRQSPGMVSCDVLDQRLLAVARTPWIPATIGAILIGTIEADTEELAGKQGEEAVDRLRTGHDCAVLVEPTCKTSDRSRVQAFRHTAVAGLYGISRGRRPEAFLEDIAVPCERVAEFVLRVQEQLRTVEVNASFLVHLLTGQIHTRPFLDVANPDDCAKMWPLAETVHHLALDLGGTISTQHGVGLARTPWVEKQYGAVLPVFREVKRIFDPKNILNPGKILGPDPTRPAWPMPKFAREPKAEARQTLLVWNSTTPLEEAAKCNGCGDCRPRTEIVRMCPIFRATGDEAATPRAKANLFKLLDDSTKLETAEIEAISRHCVNCKMCREECSSKVDVPKLMLEAKAAHYEEHGWKRREWLLARAESLVRFSRNFTSTVNLFLRMRWSRWLLEKLFGLSRHRQLPRFAHRTFLRRARRSGWTQLAPGANPRKVAYFVDVFANHCDPLIGEAAVAVLKHHGYVVVVPWQQRGSGMTPLAFGDVEAAREVARYNLRTLAELARDGYTIVCTEPTAVVALVQDYGHLLNDADTEIVAKHTVELMAFLGELHARGDLKLPTHELPIGLGHHVPCHVKALGKPPAAPALLALIPGATVETIDKSCSGMAGMWGLLAANGEASRRAGAEMIRALDRPRILYGSTECSSCRIQMQDSTGKRTLHPIQYLAMGYGLVPELHEKLIRPLQPRSSD